MSAWGTGLYSDDTACDVRDDYVRHLKCGLSHEDACQKVLERYAELLGEKAIACLVRFALADTAWQYGRLDDALKDSALSLLHAGGDLFVWERDAPGDVAARRRVLATLESRLTAPQPPARAIEVVPPKPKKIRTNAPIGSVFALELPSQGTAWLVLVGFAELEQSIDPVFSIIPWRSKSPADIPGQISGGDKTLVLSQGFSRPFAHVAILPKDERRSILAGLEPVSVPVLSPMPFERGRTVWLALGRIASEVERHLDGVFAPSSEHSAPGA
jgi:hypothetical protein